MIKYVGINVYNREIESIQAARGTKAKWLNWILFNVIYNDKENIE